MPGIGVKINAEKLKRKIELAGFNQKEFAKKIEVTPVAVHYWFKGRGGPTPGKIQKITNLLGCNKEDILDNSFEAQQALAEHIAKEQLIKRTDITHFRSALIEDLSAMDLPAEILIKVLARVRTFDPDNKRIN